MIAVRRRLRFVAALALLAALGASGCADPGETSLVLSWKFADERSCLDSGAGEFTIESVVDQRQWGYFYCEDAIFPTSIELGGLRLRGEKLQIDVSSWAGALLYRGRVDDSPLPSSAVVTLYAVDAE